MKLKLKNFRCYLDKEFDFGENGILLLSGPSGSGKSSILLAIHFALYGKGTKLVSYGKTSCRIELLFNDFKIVRTKRPNRLVLNDIHEDASAQSMIDEKFGRTFDVTGYISQNAISSFVMMSPMDKLSFLEKFAFSDIDLSRLKAECKELIKKRHDALIVSKSQLEMSEQVFQTLTKPTKVEFPLKKTKSKKNKERVIQNEYTRLKNSRVIIKRQRKTIEKLVSQLHQQELVSTQIQSKQEQVRKIQKKILECNNNLSNIAHHTPEDLNVYEKKLQHVVNYQEVLSLENNKAELNKLRESELSRRDAKIDQLRNNLWTDYSKDEIDDLIQDHYDLSTALEKEKKLSDELQNIPDIDSKGLEQSLLDKETELARQIELLNKLELEKEKYVCPSCDTQLYFHDGKLQQSSLSSDNQQEDISEVRRSIQHIRRDIRNIQNKLAQNQSNSSRRNKVQQELTEVKGDIAEFDTDIDFDEAKKIHQDLKNYRLENQNRSRELDQLIREKSPIVKELDRDLQNLSDKITLLKQDLQDYNHDDPEKEENLRENISMIRQSIQDRRNIQDRITNLTSDQDQINQEIQRLNNSLTTISLSDIDKEKDKLAHLEQEEETHRTNIAQIEKYQEYVRKLTEYTDWEKKVTFYEKEEKEKRKELSAAQTMKDKIAEAESLAMINIIDSINSHVQEYLDDFFVSDPICARLLPYKESKKNKKPQINIQIEYKGMDTDLSVLSGGELSRVILAYALALGEIFNTPLMLLDECTSSLDQELTSVVIDGIRNHYSDKMVIVIAHQVVSGVFDRKIELF